MDSNFLSSEIISSFLESRRSRALIIACLVLAVLAMLQAGNLKRPIKMTKLFEESSISDQDLQRMQLAFGKSGLNDFSVVDDCLMVPKSEHATYLQSLSENDGVPQDLRNQDETSSTNNPFLSRSQQLSIERTQKKKQIRDMVMRLPFVDQAWFEMDQANSRSAFQRSKQSAVISIRPATEVTLNENHVDTVKRMIGGAIAGLNLSEIVVIDLSAGYAHQDSTDPSTTQQVRFQRIAFEQQRIYESRIREALKDYPGVEVNVQVEVNEAPQQVNQVAVQPVLRPQTIAIPPSRNIYDAGANGFVKIDEFESTEQQITPTPIALVAHTEPPEIIEKNISVLIDVPQTLVHDIFGVPTADSFEAKNKSEHQAALARDTQFKFGQLQTEIVQKVKPILPKNNSTYGNETPIAVNLVRGTNVVAAPTWPAKLRSFVKQNWPSAAVLCIGLILLSIVTRKPEHIPSSTQIQNDNDQVVFSTDVGLSETANSAANNGNGKPEVRLAKLVEQDPNAAAKVIESWIRDAA